MTLPLLSEAELGTSWHSISSLMKNKAILHKRCSPPPPFCKMGQSSQCFHLGPNSLPSPHSQFQAGITRHIPVSLLLQEFLPKAHRMIKGYFCVLKDVTTMHKPVSWGQTERSSDHSLQGRVPMVLEADPSASPADSILNSLSGWNIQEALEEWIIHSLVLLPMDLCFLVPIRHSVFVLTVIGDVCASFDGSWGQAISSICSTHSNSTIHKSACQTQLSSEVLMAASLTKWLDSFQGSVHHPSFLGSCWHLLCHNLAALVWTLLLSRWHFLINLSPVFSYTMGSKITVRAQGSSWPAYPHR